MSRYQGSNQIPDMPDRKCTPTCVHLPYDVESLGSGPCQDALCSLQQKTKTLDAIFIENSLIQNLLPGVSRQDADRNSQSLAVCNDDSQHGKSQDCNGHVLNPDVFVEYTCSTQTSTKYQVQSRGLSLHVHPGTKFVKRWRAGSTLLYFVSAENLPNSAATLEYIKEGMNQATNEWHRADINISFQETQSRDGATFTVIYDTELPRNDFAQAFFPGDSERIIRIGPLAFEPANVRYISNILSHELGHVLALRHDSWEDAGEGIKASRGGKGEPAWYFPSKNLNHSSIMNHKNAFNLSLLVVGDRDRDEASRFYKLAAGKYGDVEVVDVVP